MSQRFGQPNSFGAGCRTPLNPQFRQSLKSPAWIFEGDVSGFGNPRGGLVAEPDWIRILPRMTQWTGEESWALSTIDRQVANDPPIKHLVDAIKSIKAADGLRHLPAASIIITCRRSSPQSGPILTRWGSATWWLEGSLSDVVMNNKWA